MPGQTFYQYLDASGGVHLVDQLEKVPLHLQEKARKIELPAEEAAALKEALGTFERLEERLGKETSQLEGQVRALTDGREVEPVSFGLGFLSALLLSGLLWLVKGTAKLALKLALLALLGVLLAGLYFGYVRRSAGLSESVLSDPRDLVEDAQRAADRLDARQKSAEKVLREVVP